MQHTIGFLEYDVILRQTGYEIACKRYEASLKFLQVV